MLIKVLVNGALGKMGREVVQAVNNQSDMQVAAGVDPLATKDFDEIRLYRDLAAAITEVKPDVVVDFTNPTVVRENIRTCMQFGVRMVVGTTGLTEADVQALQAEVADKDWAVLIAPNFAIGAVLMMNFAQQAAKYFTDVEIIEYHHQQKKDAPSGTAIKTAEMISQVLHKDGLHTSDEIEKIPGARGGQYNNIHIHSVRMPGYVAHQEVIFSSPGQMLTIRHDSTHRESFMPGVLLAVRKIAELKGVIYGLEQIL